MNSLNRRKKMNYCIKPALAVLAAALILSSCSILGTKKTITASGTIETTEINIATKVTGQIKKMYVTEGSQVTENQVIAAIDRSTLELQLNQTKAGQDLAQAQLELLKNGARDEDIKQAEEELTKAETSYKLANDDYTRIKELYDTKSVTQKQKDDAEARMAISLAQYNSSKQLLKKLNNFARPEDIRIAEAKFEQSKSAVDILRKNIDDCYIKSPITGIITNKPVELGELVTQGSIIATVSKLDTVNLVIYITEKELGQIKLNGDADVKIDSYPKKVFPGKIIYISPSAEFTPKNIQTKDERVKLVFRVKLVIENPDGILKPGIPADAVIKL